MGAPRLRPWSWLVCKSGPSTPLTFGNARIVLIHQKVSNVEYPALREGFQNRPPSPHQISQKGGGGGWPPNSHQMSKETLNSLQLYIFLRFSLILVSWNWWHYNSRKGHEGSIWPLCYEFLGGGSYLWLWLQWSHGCNWGLPTPLGPFILTRGATNIKFLEILTPPRFFR